MIRIQEEDFAVDPILDQIRSRNAGATVLFIGTVREISNGREVDGLHIECHRPLATEELNQIAEEARMKFSLSDVVILHRYGELRAGDNIVLVAAVSARRQEAFEAARFMIEALKQRAKIWKKERFHNGEEWVEGPI